MKKIKLKAQDEIRGWICTATCSCQGDYILVNVTATREQVTDGAWTLAIIADSSIFKTKVTRSVPLARRSEVMERVSK